MDIRLDEGWTRGLWRTLDRLDSLQGRRHGLVDQKRPQDDPPPLCYGGQARTTRPGEQNATCNTQHATPQVSKLRRRYAGWTVWRMNVRQSGLRFSGGGRVDECPCSGLETGRIKVQLQLQQKRPRDYGLRDHLAAKKVTWAKCNRNM